MATLHAQQSQVIRQAIQRFAPEQRSPAVREEPLDVYLRMREVSADVREADAFLRQNVSGRLADYVDEAQPQVAEAVNVHVMETAREAAFALMGAVYFGAVLAELVWETEPELHLAGVHLIPPRVWWDGTPVRAEETQRLIGWDLPTQGRVDFFGPTGVRHIVHWAPDAEARNAYGSPAARRVFNHYDAMIANIARENTAADVAAIARILIGVDDPDTDGETVAEAVASLGENGVAALKKDVLRDPAPVILSGQLGSGSPFEPIIHRHLVGIYRAMRQPPLMQHEAQFGTRAQASEHRDAYLGTETWLATRLARDVIDQQIVRTYLDLRFGPQQELGRTSVTPAVEPSMAEIVDSIQKLKFAGFVSELDEGQRSWVAESTGVPPLDEGLVGVSALQEAFIGAGEGRQLG